MAIKKKFPYKAAFVACNGGCRAKDCRYGCIGCGPAFPRAGSGL